MSESLRLEKEDVLVFICAFLFAIQILLEDHFVKLADLVEISCINIFSTFSVHLINSPCFCAESGIE